LNVHELTASFGVLAYAAGAMAVVILFLKALTNSFDDKSLFLLSLTALCCILAGLALVNNAQALTAFALISLLISIAAAISLVLKSIINNLNDAGSIVLFLIFVLFLFTGIFIMKVLVPAFE